MIIGLIMNGFPKIDVLRELLLVPWILSNVVVALLWLWLMDSSVGILNVFLDTIGFQKINFLTTTQLALPSIAVINIWRHMGYTGLLVFAGLQTVPKEIEEAAVIDGATNRQKFWFIIIPHIKPILAFVIITSVIGSFQIYDTVAIITRGSGGPVRSTYVLNLYIFKNAFENYKMGYASAASMMLFVILIGVSVIQMKLLKADKSDV
jgi:multiple sugar transport system permease protein